MDKKIFNQKESRKRKGGTKKRWNKWKTSSKIENLNLTKPISILNVRFVNIP